MMKKPLSNLQTAQAKLTGDHIYCTNERERLPQIRIHRQKEAKKQKKLKQTHTQKNYKTIFNIKILKEKIRVAQRAEDQVHYTQKEKERNAQMHARKQILKRESVEFWSTLARCCGKFIFLMILFGNFSQSRPRAGELGNCVL